jgi:hypothetical protein
MFLKSGCLSLPLVGNIISGAIADSYEVASSTRPRYPFAGLTVVSKLRLSIFSISHIEVSYKGGLLLWGTSEDFRAKAGGAHLH